MKEASLAIPDLHLSAPTEESRTSNLIGHSVSVGGVCRRHCQVIGQGS